MVTKYGLNTLVPDTTSGKVLAGVGIAVGSAVAGALIGRALAGGTNSSTKRRKKAKKKNNKHTYKKKKGRRYIPHTAGKRKDTSRRRIRYTKNGQPYVIGKGGKARFIKRISAHASYKRKGGRY